MKYWLEVHIDREDGTPCDFVEVQVYEGASPEALHAIARDLARIEGYPSNARIRWEYFQDLKPLLRVDWTEQ